MIGIKILPLGIWPPACYFNGTFEISMGHPKTNQTCTLFRSLDKTKDKFYELYSEKKLYLNQSKFLILVLGLDDLVTYTIIIFTLYQNLSELEGERASIFFSDSSGFVSIHLRLFNKVFICNNITMF